MLPDRVTLVLRFSVIIDVHRDNSTLPASVRAPFDFLETSIERPQPITGSSLEMFVRKAIDCDLRFHNAPGARLFLCLVLRRREPSRWNTASWNLGSGRASHIRSVYRQPGCPGSRQRSLETFLSFLGSLTTIRQLCAFRARD